jgi:hypothetical protein
MNNVGATVPVQSIKACVVYNSSSGQIYHEHRVLTLGGGREPAESEIAADALRAIGKRRQPPGGALGVLHIHHLAMERGKRYRVDVTEKELVVE